MTTVGLYPPPLCSKVRQLNTTLPMGTVRVGHRNLLVVPLFRAIRGTAIGRATFTIGNPLLLVVEVMCVFGEWGSNSALLWVTVIVTGQRCRTPHIRSGGGHSTLLGRHRRSGAACGHRD